MIIIGVLVALCMTVIDCIPMLFDDKDKSFILFLAIFLYNAVVVVFVSVIGYVLLLNLYK